MKRSIQELVRKNISNLKAYSSARDEFSADAKIFLDANENPFGDGLNRYPDATHNQLKTVLAENSGVNADQILLGNGSDEVLDLIFRTFCDPGKDNVIITPPTYGMYQVIADINNVEVRKAWLTANFELDVDSVLQHSDSNTKLVVMCSPNNPSGNSMNSEAVEELLKKMDCLVVIDEAYIEFSESASWSKRLAEFPNLIISQTFSKAWGLAGIRLGLAMTSVEINQFLHKVKPPYNVNALTQEKALEALENTTKFKSNISMILSEREKLVAGLNQCRFVEQVFPSDANFVLVRVGDANLLYNYLKEKGVIVRNRTNEHGCLNTLRISIGTPMQNEQLIKTFKSYQP